jgi:purine-nucleoside phosphorylase
MSRSYARSFSARIPMSLHLDAQPGAIAPIVLLPGDPLRAQFIAERYLDRAEQHNGLRNALGYTGLYQGARVSVQSTGMGMPSFWIYAHELLESYGAKVLIRVGTCGALQPNVRVRDLILATSASTDSAMIRHRFGGMDFAPTASFDLARRAHDLANRQGLPLHAGNVLTTDTFYPDDPAWWSRWRDHGVLAAEMETAALYTVAARFGAQALSLLTVSDHIVTGEHTPADERQRGFGQMAEIALELAAQLAAAAPAAP